MNKNIKLLVEETLDSFNNLQKVDAPYALNQRILNRISQPQKIKEVYLFRNPQWLIAALVIGIICNVYFAISYTSNSNLVKSTIETSDIAGFESHFRLESSTNSFE